MKKFNAILSIMTLSFFITGCNFSKTESSSKTVNLTISAAASLQESMEEIKVNFEKEHPNITLTLNYGSSGSLQKQIEQGAPSDLFISAGQTQMNSLEDENLILTDSKKDLLKNELVLITSSNNDITSISDLSTDKVMHIAMGEPTSVPAGSYAKESLNNLNLYDSLSSKLVFAKDVKEVLSWVSTQNAEVGFVYKSDTIGNNTVKIVEPISESYHSPIIYPIGIVKSTSNMEDTKEFYNYLFTEECQKIFEKYGYSIL